MKQSHEGRGYGVDLVRHAEEMARARGIRRVFALTNRAADFFQCKVGYAPGTLDDLPVERRRQYESSGRDSLVFVRDLGDPSG